MQKTLAVAAILVVFSDLANANACWYEAASRYRVNPDILRSISYVESRFNRYAKSKINRNGTYDICHMQINSGHFDYLSHFGITERTLTERPCVCTEVGAWALAQCIARFGNTWEAVGCYNAGPLPDRRALRLKYARSVRAAYQEITTGNEQ